VLLRRRAWLSREGWYYVAVLAFIVGGAVLRNVNLLVVLAGMMTAPLVLNWRLVMASLRGLSVQRKLPPHAHAGEPLTVELAVHNNRSRFSSWLLRLEDRIERVATGDEPVGAGHSALQWSFWRHLITRPSVIRADALLAQAAAEQTTVATYRVTIHRRGRYRFGPMLLSTRYPLGLIRGHVRIHQGAELVVVPRLGRLTQRWNEITEADMLGDERRHPRRGFAEGDYYGLRPWQTGDSQRWIHWRTTAKLNTPTVRQFERQQSHDLAIVLDPWLPDQPLEEEVGRLELAISLAATAVAEMCQRGGGSLTFAVAGSPAHVWTAPASPLLAEEILLALGCLRGSSSIEWQGVVDQVGPTLSGAEPLLAISSRSETLWRSATTNAQEKSSTVDLPLKWIDAGSAELGELFSLD
jgi:uncharacterized protein (DUF58 family)